MKKLRSHSFLVLILFVFVCLDVTQQKVPASSDIEQLLAKDLFIGYVKEGRPVINKSDSVEVKFDMAYSQLKELDGQNQVLKSKVWFRQYWTNQFLVWDPKKYGGIKSINVSPELIWKPDIVLYNSVGYFKTGSLYSYDTKALIHHNGITEWFAPTEIHSICKMKIASFPFDNQRCTLKFGSWSYTAASLNLVNKRNSADLSKYIESGQWELKGVSLVRNLKNYSCCPDSYVDITYTIHVKRKIKYYVNNLIIPCVALAALAVFAHYLPLGSGERMGLQITILLGLTVFMMLLTENIPRTSEATPLLGKYAMAVLCEVLLSLVLTCFIQGLYYSNSKEKLEGWFRRLILETLEPLLLKTTPGPSDAKDGNLNRNSCFPQSMWDSTLFLSSNTDSFLCQNLVDGTPAGDDVIKLQQGMRRIVKYLETVEENNERKTEWRLAADVIDLVFLYTLALTTVILTIAFYINVP